MSEHWPYLELGTIGVKVLDCEHRTPPAAASGYPYIAIPDLVDGRLALENVRLISGDDLKEWTRRTRPQSGDIIVTRRGRVGDTAVIPSGIECAIGQNLVILRSDGSFVDQAYLRWASRGPLWRSEVERLHNVGAIFDSLNVSDIPRIRISVPPIHKQRAIVSMLTALDGKIVVNEQIRSAAWDLAKALFDRSCRDGSALQEFSIADVAYVFDGPHATPTKTSDGPWFLSISSLRNGFLDLAESAHLSESDFVQWTRRVTPQAGDILFSYETRLGQAAIMPNGLRGCLGRRMAIMRPKRGIESILLLLTYLSCNFQERIRAGAVHGATVDRIPLSEFASWKITLPIAETRHQVSSTLKALYDRAIWSMNESHLLRELRDTLLPKLISGELQIRDVEKTVEDAVRQKRHR